MLRLAAQMLRHRKGSAVATLLALVGGVMVLMTCGLLVESGTRYHGASERYAAATAVVAHRDMTVTSKVLGESEATTVALPERGTVPVALAGALAEVPGVTAVIADRAVTVAPLGAPTVPTTGHGWSSASLAPYRLVSGTPPRSEGEVVVDARLAAGARVVVGATTTLMVGGTSRAYRVSGVVEASGTGAGDAAVFFTDAQAARHSRHAERVDAIGVVADRDADRSVVVDAVRRVATGAGVKAYAGEDRGLVEQPEAASARELSIQAGAAFGGYAALIIGFVVAATVGLSVRHRRRDLALLRAIAATPRQVRRLLLAEVGLLAALAATLGVPAGLLAAAWTRDQLVIRGFVPETFTVQGGALSALATTTGVTVVALLAALVAARRTTTIRPTEALAEVAVEPAPTGKVRTTAGLVVLVGAVSLTGVAGTSTGEAALGAAIAMVYTYVLGVALLAPHINLGAARLLAPVLHRIWGTSGFLATANLRANARGMVAVLTALVLSVGFGGTVWFLQDNVERQTVVQSQEGTVAQQALVGAAGLPATAVAEARGIPGVTAATGVRRTSVVVRGRAGAQTVVAQGIDPDGADRTMDLHVEQGRLADLRAGTVAVSTQQASSSGWELGHDVPLWLGDGTPTTLRLVATYKRSLGFGDVTLARATVAGHTTADVDDHVLIRSAPGADHAALADLAARHPGSRVTGADQLTGQLARDLQISGWLNKLLIAVLVAYALLAAVNTLVMAALARTRELALLRLVGVTPRQVRRMVHAEQAGLLGVALTIGSAIAIVSLSTIVNAIAGQPIPYVPPAGWVAILGGTAALALLATVLPIGRILRTAPVEGIGLRE